MSDKTNNNKWQEICGVKFRVLDPVSMPMVRRVELFGQTYEREWGITKRDLLLFTNTMEKMATFNAVPTIDGLNSDMANKMANQRALLQSFQATINGDFQFKPYLKTACAVILIEGEDENKIDGEFMTKKLNLCRQYPEIEAFFLDFTFSFLAIMNGTISSSKPLDWYNLAARKRTESNFLSMIGSSLYEIGD